MRAEPDDELRRFADDAGAPWVVREIRPRFAERRIRDRRRPGSTPIGTVGFERRTEERRHVAAVRASVRAGYERGWLTFESGDSKCRFAPIPPNWWLLPDRELRKLLALSERA